MQKPGLSATGPGDPLQPAPGTESWGLGLPSCPLVQLPLHLSVIRHPDGHGQLQFPSAPPH